MLSLDDPSRTPEPAALTPPGGFLWWYVDALDRAGNGFVCIWSFGLPFLPGLASSARVGRGPEPGERPSVNVAIYHNHRLTAWHLLEMHGSEARFSQDQWEFGGCRFRRGTDGLSGELRLPVPGAKQPLIGSFTLQGAACTAPRSDLPLSPHRWSPIIPHARATAHFTHGDRVLLDFEGPAYHDRNESALGFDALGIDHWTWGRAAVGERTLIWYLSWPVDREAQPVLIVTDAHADGTVAVHPAGVTLGPARRTRFGMSWWPTYTVTGLNEPLVIRVAQPADDSPFYLRATARVTLGAEEGHGWTELCRPARVDRGVERPLIQMSIQHTRTRESMWLPLFAGPQDDRWARLCRWWLAGRPGSGGNP